MDITAAQRQEIAEFAATFPTPNVRRAVQAASAGYISWQAIYDLFKKALAAGLAVAVEEGEATPAELDHAEESLQGAGTVLCPNGCGHQVMAGVYIDPSLPCPN